ncbi:hypothetical protein CHH69_18535, partial [Terribacillus saccharophilus]|uniref:DUF2089 domain-containing protein n=1 Tax=Terribacillus saccharophilus TaxID=361277 RepID=UPI000BD11A45
SKEIDSFQKWSCPACSHKFEKKVTRKCKCPTCNTTIYKRTLPLTGEEMLISKERIHSFQVYNDTFYEFKYYLDFAEKMNLPNSTLTNIAKSEFIKDAHDKLLKIVT